MKQFEVQAKNQIGEMAKLAETLSNNKINIKAVATEKDAIKLITENEKTTRNVLEKAGYRFVEKDIIIVPMKDNPGELAKVARKLAEVGVNITSTFNMDKERGKVVLAMTVDDLKKARKVLK